MNVTVVIIKNTAPLDFIFPVLMELNHTPSPITCNILYCDISKYRFLRKSKYYSKSFRQNHIREYDYLSFLPFYLKPFTSLLQRLLGSSQRDGKNSNDLLDKIIQRIEHFCVTKIKYNEIMPSLQPDLILIGNTEKKRGIGVQNIFQYIIDHNTKTILLPHAPHHRDTNIIIPFYKEMDLLLPKYCEYWLPYIDDKPWINAPTLKNQFHYIGYPGLDSKWLHQIVGTNPERKTKNFLFIIRKFNPKTDIQDNTHDFVYSYEEVAEAFQLLDDALKSNFSTNINVIVKPHPSNDFQMVEELISELGLTDWSITYEPIYKTIKNIDIVFSMYSTTHLIPAMAGIPVVLLASSIQDIVENDEKIQQIYQGMRFHLTDNKELSNTIHKIISSDPSDVIQFDQQHLRKHYPDFAIERSLDRITHLLSE